MDTDGGSFTTTAENGGIIRCLKAVRQGSVSYPLCPDSNTGD
jgi:hypothetical protein